MVRSYTGSGPNDCGNEKRFVNIDAVAGLINNFHGQKAFRMRARSHWLFHLAFSREVKTILAVRSNRAAYLYLKDNIYTDYYAV